VLPRIKPMRLRRFRELFNDPDYIFELKQDGFRVVVYLQNGECKLEDLRRNALAVRGGTVFS